MPYTVNGIGTTYFGKSNRQSQDGVCESCHRRGKLSSYETWHCICVLFIPIIPIGKKQILDYCPSCSRHRVMPFHEWVKIRDKAIGETASQFSESSDDPDKAIEMHATLAAFQKQDEATKLAEMLEGKFATVARVQFYLASWYERTGKPAIANRLFLRSFELAPDDLAIRRAALLTFVEQGNIDQAKGLMQPFLPGTEHFEPALFYALATGFQKQGRHQEAVHTLRMLLDAAPGLKSDKTFRKALAISEKALGVEELTIPSDPFYRTSAFKWVTAIAAIMAALGLWNSYIASNRVVTVVNGLPIPISVKVDSGKVVQVNANGQTDVALAEGRHEAEVVTPAGKYPNVVFEVTSDWLDRYFRRPVFVLDPTKSAAVLWEEATYVPVAQGHAPETRHELRLGEAFTSYKNVDYRFEEFPEKIKLDRKSGQAVKTRLAVVHEDVADLVQQGRSRGKSPAAMLPFLETHLQAAPEKDNLLLVYVYYALQADKIAECRNFLSTRLTDRPIRVEWHRRYQGLATHGLSAEDAKAQLEKLKHDYDQLIETEPMEPSLLYLRGRLEEHGRLSTPYYERALAIAPQHPYALYASANDHLVLGEFKVALDLLNNAVAAKPNDIEFKHSLIRAQFAAADYEALEKTARDDLNRTPLNPSALELLLKVLVAQERSDDADKELANFSARFRQIVPAQFHNLLDPLKWMLASMKGDFEQIDQETATSQNVGARQFAFFAKTEQHQLVDPPAEAQAAEAAYWHLCRALVARRLQNQEQESNSRETALTLLESSFDHDRAAAELLRNSATVGWDDISDLTADPGHKAVLLVVLAHERADLRSQLLDLAQTLNFDLEFPHFLIKREIEDLRQR